MTEEASPSASVRRPAGGCTPTRLRRASLPLLFYLLLQVVLNQKFTDCFVLVFLDSHLGKTVRTKGEGLPGGCTPVLPSAFSVLPTHPLTCLPPTVPDGGLPRALPGAAPGQRESPGPAGLHLPPLGVCHQHRLFHPLDPPPLRKWTTDFIG